VAEVALVRHGRTYAQIAWLWVRAAWQYPASFVLLAVGNGLISGLDFVGLWIMFAHLDELAGFTLHEVGFLYGAGALSLGVADSLIGSVERIGTYVRTGRLDQMLTKPVPLLVQVCADQFTLRRLGRITQATVVFGWACTYVDWSPARVLVAASMLVSGAVIFFALFVTFSCVQFWTTDASEFANAFTYGGATITSATAMRVGVQSTYVAAQPKTTAAWVIRPRRRSVNWSAQTCTSSGTGLVSIWSSRPVRT